MALNNDDCVIGVPSIQCPSCGFALDLIGPKIGKLSKRQRKEFEKIQDMYSTSSSVNGVDDDAPRVGKSEHPERTFVVVSCGNHRCEQYNSFKVIEVPRIKTATAKV